MFTATELRFPIPVLASSSPEDHLELCRLLAAAVVNPSFRDLLLQAPLQAIENGYQGETFHLSDSERYLLQYIHADSLADLACQLVQVLRTGFPVETPAYSRMPDFAGCGQ